MNRISKRLLVVKINIRNRVVNTISIYALQIELDKNMRSEYYNNLNSVVGTSNEKLIV